MKLHDVSKLFQQYQSIMYNSKLVNSLIYRQVVNYRARGPCKRFIKKKKERKNGTKIETSLIEFSLKMNFKIFARVTGS